METTIKQGINYGNRNRSRIRFYAESTNLHVVHQQTVEQVGVGIAEVRQVGVLVNGVGLLRNLLEACIITGTLLASHIPIPVMKSVDRVHKKIKKCSKK